MKECARLKLVIHNLIQDKKDSLNFLATNHEIQKGSFYRNQNFICCIEGDGSNVSADNKSSVRQSMAKNKLIKSYEREIKKLKKELSIFKFDIDYTSLQRKINDLEKSNKENQRKMK